MTTRKMRCFYHNDEDGEACAVIVSKHTGVTDPEAYVAVDYVKPLPIEGITSGFTVWLVDYSITEVTLHYLERLLQIGCELIWIDHHASSIKLENEYKELKDIKGVRSKSSTTSGYSAAVLTYFYCYNTTTFVDVPAFIRLISDYDCWQYQYGSLTNNFKNGIGTRNHTNIFDSVWDELWNSDHINRHTPFSASLTNKLIEIGKPVGDFVTYENTKYRNEFAYESVIKGYPCLVVNKRSNSWIFGDMIAEYPIVVTWVFNGKYYSYSLFSTNPEIDCSLIAESFGGGGHPGAAGFKSKKMLFKCVANREGFLPKAIMLNIYNKCFKKEK